MFSYLRADLLKTKRLSIRKAHLLIPIITTSAFIAYYAYSPWNKCMKVNIFYQVLGMGLPFLIGLFCAILSEQEESAGYFQKMLMQSKKVTPFLSKLFLLLLFCLCSLLMTSLIFGVLFNFVLKENAVGFPFYLFAALVMFASSIPMYILHLFLSLRFNKGVSIGLGIVESVVSALFLTGLGDSLWKYVPPAWLARMTTTFFSAYTGDIDAYIELKQVLPIYCIVMILGFLAYVIWAYQWEGTRTAD